MELDDKYKLNLQFFAEDGEGDSGKGNEDKEPGNDSDDSNEESKFTQSEVDSKIGKAVDKALSNQSKKFEQILEQARKEEREKTERYAKLTEREKQEAELTEREKALAEKEKEFQLRELKTDVESDLKEKGLPTSFAESLIHLEDNEKISEVVNEIKADFDKAVQEQVKEATRQTTPAGQQSNLGSQKQTSTSFADIARENRIVK